MSRESTDHLYPFDGDPPSHLLDDIDTKLDDWKERLEFLLEEARQEGLVTFVAIGAYDPLTGTSHMRTLGRGDYHAQIGLCHRWLQQQ